MWVFVNNYDLDVFIVKIFLLNKIQRDGTTLCALSVTLNKLLQICLIQ